MEGVVCGGFGVGNEPGLCDGGSGVNLLETSGAFQNVMEPSRIL